MKSLNKSFLLSVIVLVMMTVMALPVTSYTYDNTTIKFITNGTTNADQFYFMLIDTTEAGELRGFISGRFSADSNNAVALEIREEVTQTSNLNVIGYPDLDSIDYILVVLHSPDSYYAYTRLTIEAWDDNAHYNWIDNFGYTPSNFFWVVLEVDFSHSQSQAPNQNIILDRGRTLGTNLLYQPTIHTYDDQNRFAKCSVFDDMLNALIHGSFQNFETIHYINLPVPSNEWFL